jgi:hypothetical protein
MLEMEQGHRELLEGSIPHVDTPERFGAGEKRPLDAA